jgi:hypothetical protein
MKKVPIFLSVQTAWWGRVIWKRVRNPSFFSQKRKHSQVIYTRKSLLPVAASLYNLLLTD